MRNRPNGTDGTDVLSFILGAFCAFVAVACLIVLRAICCGWEAAIGLL